MPDHAPVLTLKETVGSWPLADGTSPLLSGLPQPDLFLAHHPLPAAPLTPAYWLQHYSTVQIEDAARCAVPQSCSAHGRHRSPGPPCSQSTPDPPLTEPAAQESRASRSTVPA